MIAQGLLRVVPHILAAAFALLYAWTISGTALRVTGVQFVSPLIVILLVHLAWFVIPRGLQPGVAFDVVTRSLQTTTLLLCALLVGSVFAPQPAHAAFGDAVEGVLIFVVCAFMVAVVLGIAAGALWLIAKVIRWVTGGGRKGSGPDTRLYDVGTLFASFVLIGVLSLEGTPFGYAFDRGSTVSKTYEILRSPDQVWKTMQTATSPTVPLPGPLSILPQPTGVIVDEGTVLGANRVVQFSGREGAGRLHLQVIAQEGFSATFARVSDSTPSRHWVGIEKIGYVVSDADAGSSLTVFIQYDRKLSPAWAFQPIMNGALWLAADVLARDVKDRSENGI